MMKIIENAVEIAHRAWTLIERIWNRRKQYEPFWRVVGWLLVVAALAGLTWLGAFVFAEVLPHKIVRDYINSQRLGHEGETIEYTTAHGHASEAELATMRAARSTTISQRLKSVTRVGNKNCFGRILEGEILFDTVEETVDKLEPKHLPPKNGEPKNKETKILLSASAVVAMQLQGDDLNEKVTKSGFLLRREIGRQIRVVRHGFGWRVDPKTKHTFDTIFIRP